MFYCEKISHGIPNVKQEMLGWLVQIYEVFDDLHFFFFDGDRPDQAGSLFLSQQVDKDW